MMIGALDNLALDVLLDETLVITVRIDFDHMSARLELTCSKQPFV